MAGDFEFVGTIDVKQIHSGLDSIEKRMGAIGPKMSKSWTASGDVIRKDVQKTGKQIRRTTEETSKNFANMSKTSRQEIRQAAFAMQRFGVQGAAAWGEIFAAAGIAGLSIGAVVVSILAVTKAFKTMTTAAIDAFKTVTKLGVEAAKEYEIAGAQFVAVMKGNTKAAEATLTRVRQLSRQVGQNLTGVARAFLPEVESLDQLEDILKIATALAQYQPEQGILGARIALQEFLSGETRSLRRRFEIPQTDIDRMKEAFDTGGIAAAIDELNSFLARTGRSLEDLSDTAQVSFNRMREGWRQLAAEYGKPILEDAKEEVDAINAKFDKLRPVLIQIADAFGEVVGEVVDLIGTQVQDFIDNIDFDNLAGLADAFGGAVDAFGIFLVQLGLGKTAAGGFNATTEALQRGLFALEGTFLNLAVSMGNARRELKVWFEENEDGQKNIEKILRVMAGFANVITLGHPLWNLPEMGADILSFGGDIARGFAEAEVGVEGLTEALRDYQDRADRLAAGENIFEVIAPPEKKDASGELTADEILARDQPNVDAVVADILEAEEEIAKIREEASEKGLAKFAAIYRRYNAKIEDIALRHTRRMEEIEIQRLDKLADLGVRWQSRMIAIRDDLSRDEEDIHRRHGRKMLEIEEDLSEDRLDAHEDYRRRLDEINRRFDFDADEAVRANDAIAYLRIQRRRAFELNEAKIKRDEDVDDAQDNAEKKRDKLGDTLAHEIEDAQIANTRKLEDLNKWLNEQTAAIDTWESREKDKADRRREQQYEDARTDRQRDLDEWQIWWDALSIETDEGAAKVEERIQGMYDTIYNLLTNLPSIASLFPEGFLEGRGLKGLISAARADYSAERQLTGPGQGIKTPRPQEDLTGVGSSDETIRRAQTSAYEYGLEAGATPSELQHIWSITDLNELIKLVKHWQNVVQMRTAPPPPDLPIRPEEQYEYSQTLAESLGHQIGLSPQQIAEELANLTQQGLYGIIEQWQAILDDPTALGPEAGLPHLGMTPALRQQEDFKQTEEYREAVALIVEMGDELGFLESQVLKMVEGLESKEDVYDLMAQLQEKLQVEVTVNQIGGSGGGGAQRPGRQPGSVSYERTGGTRETYRDPYRRPAAVPPKPTPQPQPEETPAGPTSTPVAFSNRPQIENLAYKLATQLGKDPQDYYKFVPGMPLDQLIAMVLKMQKEVKESQKLPGFELGGAIGAGTVGMVGESSDGTPNPELYLPGGKESPRGGINLKLPRRKSRKATIVGGISFPGNKPQVEIFEPLVDGYIVPIRQLARESGKSGKDVMKIIRGILGSGSKQKEKQIFSQLKIEGRAFGGPVKAGVPVMVGEPVLGRANPEVFLPSVHKLLGFRELVREAATGARLPGAGRRPGATELPKPGIPGGSKRGPTGPGPPITRGGGSLPGPMPPLTKGGSASGGGGFRYPSALPPSTDAFVGAASSLRQMYFSPPFIQGGGSRSIDNSRKVEVINPEVNPRLSEIEIAQVKEIYAKLRLEEQLV